jgi:hypothetical protein
MLFETQHLYISSVDSSDVNRILETYNSNKNFLRAHMDKNEVEAKWLQDEIATMKGIGFIPCKLVLKATNALVGILDFSVKEESYLSLLMLHSDYCEKGYGSEVYQGLEDFVKTNKASCIRIDVVTNYDQAVLDFWISKGFDVVGSVELNWTGKKLPAVSMKKFL